MAILLERIHTEGIAEISYLIGDDSTGTAAVVDPRADVSIYLEMARRFQLSLTHIFETHIHADLVSGARELAAQAETAKIYVSVEGEASYGFDVEPLRDGDVIDLGDLRVTARHTPGHTPEHMSYELEEQNRGRPYAVLTGDSLFVSSAGRPDLLGDNAEELASKLYDTFFNYFAKLDDGVIIYPAHGAGSPCGADIGDRLESTIGYEKRFNPYFQKTDRAEFVDQALSTAPPEPTYYQRMKKINAEGPEVLGHLPRVPALAINQFKNKLDHGKGILVDTRSALAFGGGHIEGALNIGASPMLTVWAGWLLDPQRPILLVLEDDTKVEEVTQLFLRSGYTRFAGYLAGGMGSWETAGHRLVAVPQMTVHEVETCTDDLQILDVRAPSEWEEGHVPCARHLFLPKIVEHLEELDKGKPVVTYCATGYRASAAASILQRQGFDQVRTMPGSWTAWNAAGLPIANGN